MTFRRSLYVRILVASFAAAAVSGFAFATIFLAISKPSFERVFRGYHQMQAEEAARAWDTGGVEALASYLSRLSRAIEGRYYLADRTGRDLVDGTDRSDLIGIGRSGEPHPVGHGLLAVAQPSSDARYQLIFVAPPPFGLSNILPYYALILAAIALLCWWLAIGIATPLRDLARVAERFGRGSLKGQIPYEQRTDEVGDLARSFAEMAARIDTLLTAERRLLTDISHEVRSPLARLSMAVELLRTAPDRAAAADRAEKEVQQLTALVESLVEITRVEGDPSTTLTDVVDVGTVVTEVVDSYHTDAAARGLRLELKRLGGVLIPGRRELLRSALDNVVRNALRYAPRGSAIEVSVSAEHEAAIVSVRDFGPGVSAQDLPRLATPFFRSQPARDARTGGVGLGLALARRAVLVHHGTFTASNAEPGLRISMQFPTRS
jgi:two-component system sensor histidine kinase CpxA